MKIDNTRVAFIESLIDLAAEDTKLVLVCADSTNVIKADMFAEKYPDRLFDVGIAEQNAVALSAGLASCGLTPFVVTYAGFITMRACEQLRTFVAYPSLNVKFVGANGGIFGGEREGVTHQFFEDLGIVRTISGITIVVPADASQVRLATKAVAECQGPVYLRIGNGRDPVVHEPPLDFELGKVRKVKSYGNDVAIFSTGSILRRALEAADLLKQDGLKVVVIEVHTLKPLDISGIVEALREAKAAVTVEDHNIIGGLGSAITEVSAEYAFIPILRIGLRDIFPESGPGQELWDRYQMGVADIMKAAKKVHTLKKNL